MAIEFTEKDEGKLVEVCVSGKLAEEDYKRFVPEFERLIEKHGKVRVLFEMSAFHGWKPGALWEDVKFDIKHHAHIERLAVIGESRWQKWMSNVCRPFTSAEIRYFDHAAADQARAWIGAN